MTYRSDRQWPHTRPPAPELDPRLYPNFSAAAEVRRQALIERAVRRTRRPWAIERWRSDGSVTLYVLPHVAASIRAEFHKLSQEADHADP